jgi:hypothetical protein
VPEGRLCDQLRAEQDQFFNGNDLLGTTSVREKDVLVC